MNQTINLKGRSYLAEKDFSEEEILYLLDLAQKLKEKKHKASGIAIWKAKTSLCCLKSLLQERAALLRQPVSTSVRIPNIWAKTTFSSAKRVDRRHGQSSRPHVRRN